MRLWVGKRLSHGVYTGVSVGRYGGHPRYHYPARPRVVVKKEVPIQWAPTLIFLFVLGIIIQFWFWILLGIFVAVVGIVIAEAIQDARVRRTAKEQTVEQQQIDFDRA